MRRGLRRAVVTPSTASRRCDSMGIRGCAELHGLSAVTTVAIVAALVCAGLWAPAGARACSWPGCEATGVVPDGPDLVVPANLPGFSSTGDWSLLASGMLMGAESPQLFRTTGGDAPLPITVRDIGDGTFLLEVPELEEGIDYRLQYAEQCDWVLADPVTGTATHELSFRAGPAAPLPTDLGATVIVSQGDRWLDVADDRGGCSESIWANVADLSASLEPFDEAWKDLVVETWAEVDGTRFRYEASIVQLDDDPWAAVALELHAWVWANCDERNDPDWPLPYGASAALPEGRYEMRVGMRIAGLADALYGDTQQVELRCEARRGADGGVIDHDAGMSGDAGPTRQAESSGCQSTVPKTRATSSWPWVLGLCAACGRLRRRPAVRS